MAAARAEKLLVNAPVEVDAKDAMSDADMLDVTVMTTEMEATSVLERCPLAKARAVVTTGLETAVWGTPSVWAMAALREYCSVSEDVISARLRPVILAVTWVMVTGVGAAVGVPLAGVGASVAVHTPVKYLPEQSPLVEHLKQMLRAGGVEGNGVGPVGREEGRLVGIEGCAVGLPVGRRVGCPVGVRVGVPVGWPDGSLVGWPVGNRVGDPVGCPVGFVGLRVGCPVGSRVGCPVGLLVLVGFLVGCPVGALVGWPVGILTGWREGCPVGCLVGSPVGWREGCLVGCPVGCREGCPVGCLVGCLEGCPVGFLEGLLEGCPVGYRV